ncbi:MAG: hypothetical protein K2J65_00595 [Duncaniella sp.]|nr:hypothetical protein [Duncaniella sp.]
MKKYISTLGAALVTALTFTSCLGSHSDSEQTYTSRLGSTECINRVEDLETGDVYIANNGAAYQVAYNFTQGTITTDIAGLNLSPNLTGLSLRIPTLPLKVDETKGFYVCSGTDLIPENAQSAYVFNSFALRSIPGRAYNNQHAPVYCINFVLNNRYRVSVIQKDNLYFGKTNIVATDGSSNYTTQEPACRILLDTDKKTARLYYANIKFTGTSMVESFYVSDLPYTITANGYTIQAINAVNPYGLTGVKNEDATISNINVAANTATGANVSFRYESTENGVTKSYNISAPLEYYVYPDKTEN